jgi:hypothetical protein
MARKLSRVLVAAAVVLGIAVAQSPASLIVPTTGATVVGALALDGVAQGTLVAGGDGVACRCTSRRRRSRAWWCCSPPTA